MSYNPLFESVDILVKDRDPAHYGQEFKRIQTILENTASPVTKKYQEKLFQSVIDKGHIDFGGIEKSAGHIDTYIGYSNMVEILETVEKLAMEQKNKVVLGYVQTVKKAIDNINNLSSAYSKGFQTKTAYVMIEYNTMVYTCVEATSTILYEFVDYMKRPDLDTFTVTLKNNKLRANEFFFTELQKFNNVEDKMGIEHRKMLEAACEKGKNNFIGVDTMVGVAAISLIAMSIIPITRSIIYHIYHLRSNLANSLEMQAGFLEMNKTCVEANAALTADKKKKVLDKQVKLRNKLLKMADKIKVKNATASKSAEKELKDSNKLLTIDNLQDEVSNSPFELL